MDPNILRLAMGGAGAGAGGPQLWAWGNNSSGQLGQGNTTNRSSPVQVGLLTDWSVVSGGNSVAAIKTDGTLWTWGGNFYGQLGLGDTTSRSSPVQVGSGTNWATVVMSKSSNHCLAIKTDGTLWAWGLNLFGQLGQGNNTYRSSPVQVGSGTNWSKVFSENNTSFAITTSGALYSWGFNSTGQMGTGNTNNYNTPQQVGALTNWSSLGCGEAHCIALKTNGTIWSWGINSSYGQLGHGDKTNRSSPVQIGSQTYWTSVSATNSASFGIGNSGRLYAWGYNSSGQLGIGNTTDYSSPKQVGALTNWSKISGGGNHCISLKTDGSLWSWGNNFASGQLGLGDITNRSSPVQIGALSTWTTPIAGNDVSFALKV